MIKERTQHRLKCNKTTEFPYHFVFFDTETRQVVVSDTMIEHELRLGAATYWRREDSKTREIVDRVRFTTNLEFWEFVNKKCTKKRRLIIISHNLPFDMGVVKGWAALDSLGFKPTKIILDYNCNIWKFSRDSVSIMLIDNMNYFQTSLETLGESIGINKLTMPPNDADIETWFTYCERDVEVLFQAWRKWYEFVTTNELGSFGYTLASQAFNAFRHRFMPLPVAVHTSHKAIRIERNSYRGGRNECFMLGDYSGESFYLLDVSSMYPFVMRENEYPYNLISTGKKLSITKLRKHLVKYSIIAECRVETPEPCFGIKLDNKLIFPTGTFHATLTTQELIYGLAKGYIKSVYNYSLYERGYLFEDYVNFFYESRLGFERQGAESYAYMCKIMLNSLYGKFGQKIEDWEFVAFDKTRDYDFWQEYDYQQRVTYTYRCINHRVEVCVGYKEGYNSLVAISSEVTANARMYLWDLIKLAGIGNVYYCDTDSLIVNVKGYKRLSFMIVPNKLGLLKVEIVADTLTVNNLKDYSIGGKVKIKGIRKNAEIVDVNTFRQYQNLGIKSGLRLKDINRVLWRTVIKTMSRKYTKGEVNPDGTVTPFVLCQKHESP